MDMKTPVTPLMTTINSTDVHAHPIKVHNRDYSPRNVFNNGIANSPTRITITMDKHSIVKLFFFWSGVKYKIVISQLKFLYPLKTLVFPAFSPPRFGPFPSFFPLREEMRETFFQAVPTTLSSSLAEVRLASLVAWA